MTTSLMSNDRAVASDSASFIEVKELIRQALASAAKTNTVEVIETHISTVFLTDRFAYKLKKPVRFDFVDFSTVKLRREACENEVRLNRRLAPRVYLGVVPVVRNEQGVIAIDQPGIPVDWLVKMQRLPASKSLDTLLREGRVTSVTIEDLANSLSRFYNQLPPVTMTVNEYRRSIEEHVIANRDELVAASHGLDSRQVRRTHSAQLRVLKLAPDMLDARVCDGRIVEGHGDLRPEHIYFTPSPVIIDCIEFNQQLRTLDVVDELAFLAMECDLIGEPNVTATVFDRYFEQSGDTPPTSLIDFYRLYRASVRAKVSALRAEQLTANLRKRQLALAGQYLDLADRYSRLLAPPLLILIRGLPGTGKSTLAEMICGQLGFELLQTDAIRKSLFGVQAEHTDFNAGRYRSENRMLVYDRMHEEAERLLSIGMSVVLDGTYLASTLRDSARQLALRQKAELLTIRCHGPDQLVLQRIKDRMLRGGALSDARPDFFVQQQLSEEPDPPGQQSLSVDTSESLGDPMKKVFEALRRASFGDTT